MIVTLLTDFGTADYFVAAMKGVILSRAPGTRLVDITHEIPRHDVAGAAFQLLAVYSNFPAGTVHLVVVDPGVGSSRDPVAVSAGGYFLVGPGNGIFDVVVARHAGVARRLMNPDIRLSSVSSTFHGRDIFAPAAAALATGFPFEEVGEILPLAEPSDGLHEQLPDGTTLGSILHIDHFGNCVTSLPNELLAGGSRPLRLEGDGWAVSAVRHFYGEADDAEPFMIQGSAGFIELSVNRGSAASALGIVTGSRVTARST